VWGSIANSVHSSFGFCILAHETVNLPVVSAGKRDRGNKKGEERNEDEVRKEPSYFDAICSDSACSYHDRTAYVCPYPSGMQATVIAPLYPNRD
jgi:hypothetical protein